MASHHAGGVADETLPLLAKPAAGASSAWHDAGTFGGASAGASADASSSSSSSSSSSLAFDPLDHLSVLAWMFYDVAWTQEWKHVLWPFLLTAACFTHAIFLARNDAMEFPHACATAAWLVGGNGAWTYMDYHPGIASDSTKLAAWRAAAIGFLALPIAIEAFVLARIRRRQRGAGGGGGGGGGGKKGAMYERHKAAAAAASVSAEKPPPATATATATAGVDAGMTDAFTASAIAVWAAVDLVNFLTEIRDGRDGGQDVGASVADAASCAAWAALAAVVVTQTAYFLWRRYKVRSIHWLSYDPVRVVNADP